MTSFKIQRPARRGRSPDLTPIMDVVFILVVFFLVVSTFSQQVAKPLMVSSPGISVGAESAEMHILRLSDGGATFDGTTIQQGELTAALSQAGDRPLRIIAGEGVSYQRLIDTLDAVQAAGLSDIRVQAGSGP